MDKHISYHKDFGWRDAAGNPTSIGVMTEQAKRDGDRLIVTNLTDRASDYVIEPPQQGGAKGKPKLTLK